MKISMKVNLIEIKTGVYNSYLPPIFKKNYIIEKIYSLFNWNNNGIVYKKSFLYKKIKQRQKKEEKRINKKIIKIVNENSQ